MLVPLRLAAGAVTKAQPLLSAIAHGSSDAIAAGKSSKVLLNSLERLRAVRRMLWEAVEEASGASSDDGLIKAMLRQHEQGLRARELADSRCDEERKLVDGVRRDILELERSMLRSQRNHRRLGVDGPAERLGEFERQQANVENVHSCLTNDLHTITDCLKVQVQKNGDVNESMRQICRARDSAMVETAKANQLLGPGENLEHYRKAKEREKITADADLADAVAECKAEIARLQEGWAETEAKYLEEMKGLNAEVRRLRQMKEENSREAERELAKHASKWSKSAEDFGDQIANGVKALDGVRLSKAQHLQREVLRSRHGEQDIAASTHRQIDAQLLEMKLQCKSKLKMEDTRLREIMNAGRRSVDVAKRNADMWEKRAEVTQEAFRGHAYKTGAYVLAKALESTPRVPSRAGPAEAWVDK